MNTLRSYLRHYVSTWISRHDSRVPILVYFCRFEYHLIFDYVCRINGISLSAVYTYSVSFFWWIFFFFFFFFPPSIELPILQIKSADQILIRWIIRLCPSIIMDIKKMIFRSDDEMHLVKKKTVIYYVSKSSLSKLYVR